ncbi:MAG: hypothetical protein SF028_13135 [Candidatus Sumerlaeia bacterium]|nr:hypothetical protein [Candidatus Sumerlaeia bacterium]
MRVLLKVARGHFWYEMAEFAEETPAFMGIKLFAEMDSGEMEAFEAFSGECRILPEIGSRSFLECISESEGIVPTPWRVIQEGRYRYRVVESRVAIVLSEFIACEVIW